MDEDGYGKLQEKYLKLENKCLKQQNKMLKMKEDIRLLSQALESQEKEKVVVKSG